MMFDVENAPMAVATFVGGNDRAMVVRRLEYDQAFSTHAACIRKGQTGTSFLPHVKRHP
eukprot:SAG31_NODE_359_length_17032_cov_11.017894_3_plen_59_part_00